MTKISELPIGWQGRVNSRNYSYKYIFRIKSHNHIEKSTSLYYKNLTTRPDGEFFLGTVHWAMEEENYLVIENPEDKEYHDLWI